MACALQNRLERNERELRRMERDRLERFDAVIRRLQGGKKTAVFVPLPNKFHNAHTRKTAPQHQPSILSNE